MKQSKQSTILALFLMIALFISACGTGNQNQTTDIPKPKDEAAENSTPAQSETSQTELKTEEIEESASINPKDPAEQDGGSTTGKRTAIRLIGLNGPTGMGFSKLLADSEAGETVNDYTMTIAAAPDNLIAAAAKDEADIIAMPSNLASILWNKTEGEFEVLAINTLGVLNIVEKGETIQSIADLKDKTVIASGKGAAPEYAFDYLLKENGLDPVTDLQIEWKAEHQEVVGALAATENAVGLLPQPFVTVAMTKVEGLRAALDLNDVWQDLDNQSEFVMGVVVANKSFIAEHPQAIAQFLTDYQASVDFVNQEPAEAGALIEKYHILDNAQIAEKAIPYCHITCITGDAMEKALHGYLQVLFDANPQAVGGTMPDETFYFKP